MPQITEIVSGTYSEPTLFLHWNAEQLLYYELCRACERSNTVYGVGQNSEGKG